jgi:hypothetical protein
MRAMTSASSLKNGSEATKVSPITALLRCKEFRRKKKLKRFLRKSTTTVVA